MIKKTSLLLAIGAALSTTAVAHANEAKPPKQIEWPFDGLFGHVDRPAAQRGFQVYKEVCSACHSLKRVAFRNLTEIGFSEAEVKALAASYQIKDGPNDAGEMFERPGRPSDTFPSPYPNDNAARAANNGALPPDQSLLFKARHEGGDYIYSLLTGYAPAPADMKMADGQHYNPYMAGGRIAMAQPLSDGQVTYEDGTKASVDQMSRDVVVFLQWASEPEMESRKQTGLMVLIYLTAFTAFMYFAKKNLWKKLH